LHETNSLLFGNHAGIQATPSLKLDCDQSHGKWCRFFAGFDAFAVFGKERARVTNQYLIEMSTRAFCAEMT
jgi:hypothetical protein